jgi:tRNA modification GTPase
MIHNIFDNDTIAALATPNGRGGIAVIKISGPRALSLADAVFQSSISPSQFPRTLLYGHIHDDSERIDEVLLCYMPAPKSYTGEDVVEIQSHGGHAVADTVLALLGKLGARPAEPGEFTRRAFLNGRIDLVQAESEWKWSTRKAVSTFVRRAV